MEDKHPIDKLFKDGLHDPDIPFNPKDWEMLSKKMHPRKKRRIPMFVWVTSGVAAALVLAAILLLTDRQIPADAPQTHTAHTAKPDTPTAKPGEQRVIDTTSATSAYAPNRTVLPAITLSSAQSLKPTPAYTVTPDPIDRDQIPAVARTAPRAVIPDDTAAHLPSAELSKKSPQKGWSMSVIAAPDLSGTRPLNGKLSGNLGLMATYRVNHWLSISGGALYAKKLYRADFADYRPNIRWGDRKGTPDFIEADCGVLDIPILANATLKQQGQASFFVSTGISSYLMLRETYDYIYPPHEYGYPKQFTLHNRNRHLLGIGNLSVGYRRQLTSSLSITVQPFVKVPLTGIGNGNIKLYSTGLSLSADVDLTRRNR